MPDNYYSEVNENGVVTPFRDLAAYNGVNANTKLIKDTVGWSRKQLIPYPYVGGRGKTQNNVTFLVKDDQTVDISIDGSASANTYFYLHTEGVCFSGSTYKICSNLDYNKISLEYYDTLQGESTWGNEVKNFGTVEAVTPRSNISKQGIWIIVYSGATGNHTVKPIICDADFLDTSHEPYRDTTAFPRDEQAIVGAKNWFYSGKITDGRDNITDTDNGKTIRIHNTTAGSYKMGIFQMPVEKNTDYIFTTTVDWTSGVGNVGIASENAATDIKVYGQITSDKDVEVKFNSGNNSFIHVKLLCTWSDSVVGDVTYTNNMLRLASDPDPTYARHAMTNEQLTGMIPLLLPITSNNGAGKSVKNIDLDDLKGYENGLICWSNADASTIAHKPSELTGAGACYNLELNEGFYHQIVFARDNNAIYMRHGDDNNGFSAWAKFTLTTLS